MKLKLKNTNITNIPILIDNVDVNKTVGSKITFLVKMILNISLAVKKLQKLDLYSYFFQKWVLIEDILMKLNVYLFW